MSENVQGMLISLAKQGLKVMFVAQPDACRVCRSLQGRIFDPLEAPPIPVRQCLTPPCRCRYEGYDVRSVVERLLIAGVHAVKEERLEEARDLLYQVIDLDERNEKAWLWLSGVVEGANERILCLENVLAINPHHQLARQGLRHLLAQRAEVSAGQQVARKIRDAKEAIDQLKASQAKVMTLKEAPRVVMALARRESATPTAVGGTPKTQAMLADEGSLIGFAMVFLLVLLSVSVIVLILAIVLYAATMLR